MFASSCKKASANQNEISKNIIKKDTTDTMRNNLPYTSDNVKQYYKYDTVSVSYIVDMVQKGLSFKNFDEENKRIHLKENDFEVQLNPKYEYYILETFKFSQTNTAKLIIYNTFGENDSKILNIQLNSYLDNKLVDQLLLDCRFIFETEYYRTFIIDADKKIEIVKHTVDNLEYNEAGDIIGEKELADSTKIKVNYTLDPSGKFIKQ
jgi:hypothetical protein